MSDAPSALAAAAVPEDGLAAFGDFVARHQDALVSYLARLTGGDHARAEELAQEAFVRLYQNRWRYPDGALEPALLYRTAINLVRSEERKARRRRLAHSLLEAVGLADPPPTPQAAALGVEAQAQLARALAQVPLVFREPLVLRDVEDWSCAEIARALDCPEGTVKSRISRGREHLRALLKPYWREEEAEQERKQEEEEEEEKA